MANDTSISKKLDEKDIEILKILVTTPEGLRVKTIQSKVDFPRRTLYNHLKKLQNNLKLIRHIAPIYKCAILSDVIEILAQLNKSSKYTEQGHKIAWVLPLINKPEWWDKRKDRLMRLKEWAFKKDVTANNNRYYQIKNDYMQIQTYKNSIYFICQKEYNANSPLEIFEKAKDDVLEAIRYLEEQFRFKLLADNYFHLTLIDSHYATLKDALAEEYQKEGKRFKIPIGKYFLWVDFSEPFGLESNNIEVKRRYLDLIKDVTENPLIPLPSELTFFVQENAKNLSGVIQAVKSNQEMLVGVPKNMELLAKQIELHLNLIQEYRQENIAWRKKKEKDLRKELKYGVQTKLDDFKI